MSNGEEKKGEERQEQVTPDLGQILQGIGESLKGFAERLDRLEKPSGGIEKFGITDPEQLLAELDRGKPRGKEEEEEVDWETLGVRPEAVNFILSVVQDQLIKPLDVKIELVKVKEQIRDCEKKYEDFWDYKKEIYAIGSANPQLTVEQAYLLARTSKAKTSEKGEEKKEEKKEETKPQVLPFGEKPGVKKSSAVKGEPADLKGAAQRAVEEALGETKT